MPWAKQGMAVSFVTEPSRSLHPTTYSLGSHILASEESNHGDACLVLHCCFHLNIVVHWEGNVTPRF